MSNFRCPALLKLARDQSCTNCGSLHGVVAAHSNQGIHGKGKSLKANDCFHAHLCFSCHAWLDQGTGLDPTGRFAGTREGKGEMFAMAMDATTLRLWAEGKIKVAA